MKILYITTIGTTMSFFKSVINELITEGNIVDIATNASESSVPECFRAWGCQVYPLTCTRSPFDKGNIKAVRQIRQIVIDGNYDIVHCHTPIAAACTRLACRGLRAKGVKVIYTAHGFHFYKGAPLKNWLVYYPVEKLCAHWTDTLITITKEDYELAKRKLRAKHVAYVPGGGIDVEKFSKCRIDRAEKRRSLGIPEDAYVILSVGELNENKNQQIILRAMAEMNDPNLYYVIAGIGETKDMLAALAAELNVHLKLLGYRNDVDELYAMADLYALPSIREGLNVSIMEAMASGLPVICRKIRGNVDLVDDEGGVLVEKQTITGYAEAIQIMQSMGKDWATKHNQAKALLWERNGINSTIESIYKVH